jgi:hypothetical protein
MVDVETVRQITLSLPEAEDRSPESALHFYVRGKHFAWSYLERVEEKRPRLPRLDVLAARCPAEEKESILESDPKKFSRLITTTAFRRCWSGWRLSTSASCVRC